MTRKRDSKREGKRTKPQEKERGGRPLLPSLFCRRCLLRFGPAGGATGAGSERDQREQESQRMQREDTNTERPKEEASQSTHTHTRTDGRTDQMQFLLSLFFGFFGFSFGGAGAKQDGPRIFNSSHFLHPKTCTFPSPLFISFHFISSLHSQNGCTYIHTYIHTSYTHNHATQTPVPPPLLLLLLPFTRPSSS